MTITSKWLRYLLLIPLGLGIIIEGLWLIAIPEELLKDKLISFVPEGMKIEFEGFRKKIIPGIYIKNLFFKAGDTEFELKEINILPECTSLFSMKPGIKITDSAGILNGAFNLDREAFLKVKGLRLSEFKNPYLKGDCAIFIEAEIKGQKGTMEFSCREARLEPFRDNDIYVPLNLIDEIKGKIALNEKDIIIESITLSGMDIYGRIKGNIKNRLADLVIELMPEKSINNSLMLLIPRAMVSPGYFKIEIKKEI